MQDSSSEQQPASEQLLYLGRKRTEPLWKVPIIPTSLVGREQDVADVCTQLERPEVRLLTLFGTGGVGKTRLALQVVTEMRHAFADGVCFVHLAAVNEPELVFPAIAEALTIQESGESLLEWIMTVLQRKQMLMVLDNIEQVIAIAPQVEELLVACPWLKIVVTSREILRVQSEYVFPVSPLALPNLKQLPPDEDLIPYLSHYTAIALFLQRVRATLPGFQLTPASARAVAEICVRLDGLPLAIELAAAHIRLLSPQALLTRLSQRLHLLKQSVRTLPARQQTLSSTLDWSYHLLNEDEQRLFRCIAVFVGALTLEAVEAVWNSQGSTTGTTLSALEGVSSLLDKSLLLQTAHEHEEPSLIMLVTVREYALRLLQESGEAEMVRRAHALYYLAWAEQAEPHLKGKQQSLWQARLEQEQENLRAALQWCVDHEEAELSCRFGVALNWFWYISGHWSEGRYWLEAALHLSDGNVTTLARAKALCSAGEMASAQGDYPAARPWIEESVLLLRQCGDTPHLSHALSILSAIIADNDVTTSRTLVEESVSLAREVGDTWNLGFALYLMGLAIAAPGSYSHAFSLLEQSASLFRQLGDKRQLTLVLSQLGKILAAQNDMSQAETFCRESLVLARELGYRPLLVRTLFELAKVLRRRGDTDAASLVLQESFLFVHDVGDQCMLAMILQEMAYIACTQHDIGQATAHLQESLTLYHAMGETFLEAGALCDLANLARVQGQTIQAHDLYCEGMALARQIGHEEAIGWNLAGLAQIARTEEQWQRSARLFAAAEYMMPFHADIEHVAWSEYERGVTEVRAALGEEHFAAAWAEGRTLSPEQALAFQEETIPILLVPAHAGFTQGMSAPAEVPYPFGLTPRELEVLRLVSRGFTNVQVAEQLIVSPLTVNAHVRSIYNKLDVTSRSAATRFALEHHLV
jgi:predicted ATPase/DNA-binding CsgD family transcriptional regulator